MARVMNAPARFEGSDEDREFNRRTHHFDPVYSRCMDCDCRPWGRIAEWPCGASVPRVVEEADDYLLRGMAAMTMASEEGF